MSLKQNLLLSEDDANNLNPMFLLVTKIRRGKQRVVCVAREADKKDCDGLGPVVLLKVGTS